MCLLLLLALYRKKISFKRFVVIEKFSDAHPKAFSLVSEEHLGLGQLS